jgi:DNA-binding transcriptional MerR regulator
MILSMGQAAKAAGITKATLARYIKSGKVSAEKQLDGSYHIDASELDRIKAIRAALPVDTSTNTSDVKQSDTLHDTGVSQREYHLMGQLLQEKERLIAELQTERDAWRSQAQTLLLTAGAKQEPEKPRPWWYWRKS